MLLVRWFKAEEKWWNCCKRKRQRDRERERRLAVGGHVKSLWFNLLWVYSISTYYNNCIQKVPAIDDTHTFNIITHSFSVGDKRVKLIFVLIFGLLEMSKMTRRKYYIYTYRMERKGKKNRTFEHRETMAYARRCNKGRPILSNRWVCSFIRGAFFFACVRSFNVHLIEDYIHAEWEKTTYISCVRLPTGLNSVKAATLITLMNVYFRTNDIHINCSFCEARHIDRQ